MGFDFSINFSTCIRWNTFRHSNSIHPHDFEGVFVRFPKLRCAFLEAAAVAAYMMDAWTKRWKNLPHPGALLNRDERADSQRQIGRLAK